MRIRREELEATSLGPDATREEIEAAVAALRKERRREYQRQRHQREKLEVFRRLKKSVLGEESPKDGGISPND